MTSAQLKAIKATVPTVTNLFANGNGTPEQIGWNDPSANESGSRLINWDEGIPPDYAMPYNNGGKKVLRKDVNAVGNIASRELYLLQHGGYHTFDLRVADAIGGYPHGAILDWYQPSTGWLRKVRCVKDGGNCFTPIDNPDHGVGSAEAHWEIVDIMEDDEAWGDDGKVETVERDGFVLEIPPNTQVSSGTTAVSNAWIAPFDALVSLPFIRKGLRSPFDRTEVYLFNPSCHISGFQNDQNISLYIEVTDQGQNTMRIPMEYNVNATPSNPPDNSLYREYVESMYRLMPRMFVTKGTRLRYCCENQTGNTILSMYGYAKFDLSEVV